MILHSKWARCPSLISTLLIDVVNTGAWVVCSSVISCFTVLVCSKLWNWDISLLDSLMICPLPVMHVIKVFKKVEKYEANESYIQLDYNASKGRPGVVIALLYIDVYIFIHGGYQDFHLSY